MTRRAISFNWKPRDSDLKVPAFLRTYKEEIVSDLSALSKERKERFFKSLNLEQPEMEREMGKTWKRPRNASTPNHAVEITPDCVPRFTALWEESSFRLASWRCSAPEWRSWVIGGRHQERKGSDDKTRPTSLGNLPGGTSRKPGKSLEELRGPFWLWGCPRSNRSAQPTLRLPQTLFVLYSFNTGVMDTYHVSGTLLGVVVVSKHQPAPVTVVQPDRWTHTPATVMSALMEMSTGV